MFIESYFLSSSLIIFNMIVTLTIHYSSVVHFRPVYVVFLFIYSVRSLSYDLLVTVVDQNIVCKSVKSEYCNIVKPQQ